MTKLNVHEAKTHLSRYLRKVEEGETVLICRHGVPVAQMGPLPKKPGRKRRLFGLARGMVHIPKSFFDPMTEEDLLNMDKRGRSRR